MSNESSHDRRISDIWQSQSVEGFRMSVDQIRMGAQSFRRKIQWRNAREYAGAIAVLLAFGWQFSRSDGLVRLGFALCIAGVAFVVWKLYASGSPKQLPADAGRSNWIEFRRRELERQRDLLNSVWRWYLGPLIPGIAVLIAAFALDNPHHLQHFGLIITAYAIVLLGVFVLIGRLNALGARKLQSEIDELSRQSMQDE